MTNEAFYGNSSGPLSTHHSQQYNNINSNNSNNITSITSNNNNNNNSNSSNNNSSISKNTTDYNANTNYSNPSTSSYLQYQPTPLLSTPMSLSMDTSMHQQHAARTINQVTNSISNITHTADALNQDIDDLGISLQALAHHLGFDPTKVTPADDEKIDDDESDLLDMDEFLNTYGKYLLNLKCIYFI